MDKIVLHKMNSKPVGKAGGSVWLSVAVNDRLDALADETGIAKQRITDYLLRKALEVTVVEESEL